MKRRAVATRAKENEGPDQFPAPFPDPPLPIRICDTTDNASDAQKYS